MKSITVGDILKAAEGSLICGDENRRINAVTTDSRKAEKGMLFIPLAGERFDGHDFINQAVAGGVSAVITHKAVAPIDGVSIVKVDDTLKAMQDIAAYYKSLFDIPTVGLTGSVGKTTTKDMLAAVLGTKYNTLKTQGNFNNEIGLPLTVFGLDDEYEAAVLEMGMSGFGEIHRLARVAQHDTAVITNIGMSHIEKLGSRDGIFKAKLEIIDFFNENNTLIVNGDDEYLKNVENIVKCKTVMFGIDNKECDVTAHNVEALGENGVRFSVKAGRKEYAVHIRQAGIHNVYNALAAVCVGMRYDVPMDKIIYGLENFEPTAMRMSIEHYGGVTVINDCYNASPASMEAALKVLADMDRGRKVAVLGDMLEMGSFAPEAHRNVGVFAANTGADILVAVGKNAKHIADGALSVGMDRQSVFEVDETDLAAENINNIVMNGDAVLVKASRGMKFEKIITEIAKNEN